MGWLDDISNWFSGLLGQETKKKKDTSGYKISTPYVSPAVTKQLGLPKASDWYRKVPAPTQKATGQIGGITATAQNAQPLAAKTGTWLDYMTPAQAAMYKAANAQNLTTGTWERATPEDIQNQFKPTSIQKDTFGETPAGQSLFDTISNWVSGLGKVQPGTQPSKGITEDWTFPWSKAQAQTPEAAGRQPLYEGDKGYRVSKPYGLPEGYTEYPKTGADLLGTTGLPTVTPISQQVLDWKTKGEVPTGALDQMDDNNLVDALDKIYEADLKLPTISQQRIDAVTDPTVISRLWDAGYKSTKVSGAAQEELNNIRVTIKNRAGFDISDNIDADEKELLQLDYQSLIRAVDDLKNISDNDWHRIDAEGIVLRINSQFMGNDAQGNAVYQYQGLEYDTKYKTEAEQTTENRQRQLEQQQWENQQYWSAESTAQRNRQREESDAYNEQKQLEGYSEFYTILDSLKMPNSMDAYFRNNFGELRTMWKTSGTGKSWSQWISDYDFLSEWFKRPPSQRGERPWVFTPRMQRLNY